MLTGAAASSLPEPALHTHSEPEPFADPEPEVAAQMGYADEAEPAGEAAPPAAPDPADQEAWRTTVEDGEADEDTWIVEPELTADAENLSVETDETEEEVEGRTPTGETLPFDFE